MADPEHLVHPMRDVDDGHAASDQSSDGRKELLDLDAGQRGCRLVHHEDAGLIGQGPRELDHLLLRETELAGRPSHVDRQTQPAEQTFGLVPHPTPVDEAPPARRLSEEDVLGDRQMRNERQLLIDDADAQPTGVIGTRDLYTLARRARSRRHPWRPRRSGLSPAWTCPRRSRRAARALHPPRAPVRRHRAQRRPETACGCRASGEPASCRCEEWSRQGNVSSIRVASADLRSVRVVRWQNSPKRGRTRPDSGLEVRGFLPEGRRAPPATVRA